jgi:hypothetical protein
MPRRSLGGGREDTAAGEGGAAGFPVLVDDQPSVLVVVETGATQLGVVQWETQRFDQVQFTAGVGT